MAAVVDTSAAAPWWWHHLPLEEVATPLDPTAEEAAAGLLATTTAQIAVHTTAHAEALLSYLDRNSRDVASITATPTDTEEGGEVDLYQVCDWATVLLPLLGQLRKAMSKAAEERMAAAAAAGEVRDGSSAAQLLHNTGASFSNNNTSSGMRKEGPGAGHEVSAEEQRRLLRLQQQIYHAFFKAVMQGFVAGLRTASGIHAEEKSGQQKDRNASLDLGTKGLPLLMDCVLTHVLETAFGVAETAKSRRGTKANRSGVALSGAASRGAGDWYAGMIPAYARAYLQHTTTITTTPALVGEDESTASRMPSPALCLLSYVGAFVQQAGLQLTPMEQADSLPRLTRTVKGVLEQQMQSSTADVIAAAAEQAGASADAKTTGAVVLLHSASAFLQQLTETQLYESNAHGMGMEDQDWTAHFARPAGESREDVDYVVTPLVVLASFKETNTLLCGLRAWWMACQKLVIATRQERRQQQQAAEEDAIAGSNDATALAEVEAAWLALRQHALFFSVVLSNYAESSLLLVPYTELLVEVFFSKDPTTATTADEKKEGVQQPLENWKACLRELRCLTHPFYVSCVDRYKITLGSSSGAVGSRTARVHHREQGALSFSVSTGLRAPTVLSEVKSNRRQQSHFPVVALEHSRDVPWRYTALAYAVLHEPLWVLREKVFAVMLRAPEDEGEGVAQAVEAVVCLRGDEKEYDEPTIDNGDSRRGSGKDSANSAAPRPSRCAQALSDAAFSPIRLVAHYFPVITGYMYLVNAALHYALLRTEELTVDVASPLVRAQDLPTLYSRFLGAALEDAFVSAQSTCLEQVQSSEVLMFFVAVFRTLPANAMPVLRAALETFLGTSGSRVLHYLRHHVIAEHRHGLVAFFLPPLRALGVEYTGIENLEDGLVIAAPEPYAAAVACVAELPRLFFWKWEEKEETCTITEPAWHAAGQARRYLDELLSPCMTSEGEEDSPLQEILSVMRVVAESRLPMARGIPSSVIGVTPAVVDLYEAVFFGVCRWGAARLANTKDFPPPPGPLLSALCAVCADTESGTASVHPLLHPLVTGLERLEQRPASMTTTTTTAEAREVATSVEQPTHFAEWFFACTYDDVDAEQLLASTRHALRDFTTEYTRHVVTKTLLGVRGMTEQMREVVLAKATAVYTGLRTALRADIDDLLVAQEQQQEAESAATMAAAAEEETLQESTGAPVLSPVRTRAYCDRIMSVLTARARWTPVDGAVSAAVLSLLLKELTASEMPMKVGEQDRQRFLERFFFALTNTVQSMTRLETLSCACSLHLLLKKVVYPYKKSFHEPPSSVPWSFKGCFPDAEQDALKMLQHTMGDCLRAIQMCLPETKGEHTLGDEKALVLLQQFAGSVSQVLSFVEKVRVMVRGCVLRRNARGTRPLQRQLERIVTWSARLGAEVADDAQRLFTSKPTNASPSSPAAAAPTRTVVSETPSSPKGENANVEKRRRRSRGGRRRGGGKDTMLRRESEVRGGKSGGRGGGGQAEESSGARKRPREEERERDRGRGGRSHHSRRRSSKGGGRRN